MKVQVKALINFTDVEENQQRKIGDIWETNKERADYLLENNAIEIIAISDDKKEKPVEYTPVEAPKEAKEVKKPRVATIKNKKLTNKK